MLFEVNMSELQSKIPEKPAAIVDNSFRYDSFASGDVVLSKKKGHLPAMGWNSWNAFGSNNTEALTKQMADKFIELELDKLGYKYIILDDGCYYPERVDGKLTNEKVKFPSGFRALADYIHSKGLKFGMYNDIGTNLCAGAAVGTCGYEKVDAQTYVEWGVDFLKVDNCYYLWDNATFSNAENVRYVYAPAIKGISLKGQDFDQKYNAIIDGTLRGKGAKKNRSQGTVTGLGTFDGTGPHYSPVGATSAELGFKVEVPAAGEYQLTVLYKADKIEGSGSWLQIATGEKAKTQIYYDDFVDTEAEELTIKIQLQAGKNLIRLMNHRRQENTLDSYAKLLDGLNEAAPDHDIIYSMCEWGKTQPQNWAYKVGDSWRILNDITFAVGNNGDFGRGDWKSDYTNSVTSQYNKAVIMDEFAGLDKGWNDPDMLMVGMNGLTPTMYKTHFAMWCMMNSPLMLGLDLRRVTKGDDLYNIIANERMIALNQDPLGIQAKRIWCSKAAKNPDTYYIRDIERVDILAKPLADGSVALSFINVGESKQTGDFIVTKQDILEKIGEKMPHKGAFALAGSYLITDCHTGATEINSEGVFSVGELEGCDNVTIRISPMETERKKVAREAHKIVKEILDEADETDVKKAEVLKDLYDCRVCVEHIAQMYVKGIIQPVQKDVFGTNDFITPEEAERIYEKIYNKSLRVPPKN